MLPGTVPITSPRAASRAGPRSATVTGTSWSLQAESTSQPVNPPPTTSIRRGWSASLRRQPAVSSRVCSTHTPASSALVCTGHGRARVPVAISGRSYSTVLLSPGRTCLPARSSPVAGTPSSHRALSCSLRGNTVCPADTSPSRICLDSGGRSEGWCGLSPMRVSEPAKPLSRKTAAVRSPPSDAPAVTIRPLRRNASTIAVRLLGEVRCAGTADPDTDAHQEASAWALRNRSARMACTGHAASVPDTVSGCASSGSVSYIRASSPRMRKTSGARKAHCLYPVV
jgi:hypothetical protein